MVLQLRRPGDGAVSGLARRVLGEPGAVEADKVTAVSRGTFAAAAAPDVGDMFGDPVLGGVDQRCAGATGWGLRRLFDAALGGCQLADFHDLGM